MSLILLTYHFCNRIPTLFFFLFFQEIEMFAKVKLELQAVTQTNMGKFRKAFSYVITS